MEYFLYINGNPHQLPRAEHMLRLCKPRVRNLYSRLAADIDKLRCESRLWECRFVAELGMLTVHRVCLLDEFREMKHVSKRCVMHAVAECAAEIRPWYSKLVMFGTNDSHDSDSEDVPLWGNTRAEILRLLERKWADKVLGKCDYIVFNDLKYTRKDLHYMDIENVQQLIEEIFRAYELRHTSRLPECISGIIDDYSTGRIRNMYVVKKCLDARALHSSDFVGPFE